MFLGICFLFYNISPTDGITKSKQLDHEPCIIVMNTIISSASSCIGLVFLRPLFYTKSDPTNRYPVQQLCNALLVGLVSITGCCNNVKPWASFIIGLIGTVFYLLACKLFEKLKIDDPMEASQIHAFGGLWGLLAVSIFDDDEGLLVKGNFNIMIH